MARHPSRWPMVVFALLAVAAADPIAFAPEPPEAAGLPRVVHDDFERGGLEAWEPTDPLAWKITTIGGNRVLDQYKASAYVPPVRSPLNFALARDVNVGDLVLDLRIRSTGRDVPQRDVCLIFGYQDPSHFYYAHLARKADDVHNNLFIVDGKPRSPIGETRTEGIPWDQGWHHVRLVRKVDGDGSIRVYFDNMTRPVLTARDTRFLRGRIGFGSFDDTAMFDAAQAWGKPMIAAK